MTELRKVAENIVQRMHTMTSTGDIYDRRAADMICGHLIRTRNEALEELIRQFDGVSHMAWNQQVIIAARSLKTIQNKLHSQEN